MAKDPKRNSLRPFPPHPVPFFDLSEHFYKCQFVYCRFLRGSQNKRLGAQRSEQPSFITFCMGPFPGLTHTSIFKTLQWTRYQAGRLLDTTLLMLSKEKTPVNNEKNQRHFMFVSLLCRTKVEVHMSNAPACSALWNYSKYSSMPSLCEVPVPFAEPPSMVTPTMPVGCKSQDWQASFSVPFQSTKCLPTGREERESQLWVRSDSLLKVASLQGWDSRSKPSVHSLQHVYSSWP